MQKTLEQCSYSVTPSKCGMFHFAVLFTALHVFSHFKYANVEMLMNYWKFAFVFSISTSVSQDAAQIYFYHFNSNPWQMDQS